MPATIEQKKKRAKRGGMYGNPTPRTPRIAPDKIQHCIVRAPGGRKGGKFNNPDFRAPFFASDTLQSVATAAVQEALCEGPVRGLKNGLKSFKLDGTPVQNSDGSFNFPGIQLTMRYGYPNQDPIPGFARVRSEQPIGLEVLAPVAATNTLTASGNPTTEGIAIGLFVYIFVSSLSGAPAYRVLSGATASESLDNLIAAINGDPGEGALYSTGTDPNPHVTAEAGDGDTLIVTALTGGPSGNNVACGAPGANLEWATPTLTGGVTGVTSRVSEQNLDAVAVKIRIPALQFQDTETGDVTGSTLIIGVDIAQPDPNNPGQMLDFERVLTDTINGKASAPYDKVYRIELPSADGPWDVRVVRDTPDSTEQNLQNRLFFSGLTRIKDVRMSYPDTCVAGINIDARQFGSNIPSRTYEMYGLLIDVPANYDPETREYTGIWDGEFKTAWTDNPAWILYALLTNTRWGMGQFVESDIIDKYALYAIGQYCDERVPSGDPGRQPQFIQTLGLSPYNIQVSLPNHGYEVGDQIQIQGATQDDLNRVYTIDVVPSANDFTLLDATTTSTFDNNSRLRIRDTEPRYTCSILLNTFEDAFAAVQAIASNMRAIVYWGAGAIKVSQDSPADPTIKASPANVEGKIKYSSTSILTRYNRARVMWTDPEDSYRQHPEVYEDKEAIERDQLREITLHGVGVTRRGHAHRIAQFFVDASQNSAHIAKYVSGLDHSYQQNTQVGSIVEVPDTRIAGLRIGGRVAGMSPSSNPTQITVDAPVDLSEADQVFVFSAIMPDGSRQERMITNTGGAAVTVLELDSALDGTPIKGAMWSIASASLAPAQYRIMEIAERGDARLHITATEHDPTKYDRIELGMNLPLLDFSDLPTGILEAPQNLVANEALARQGANIVASVTLSWTASTDPRAVFYESEVRRPGSAVWERMGFSAGVEHTLTGYVDGTYDFRVRAIDSGGANKSAWAELVGRVLLGLSAPPADVTNFEVSVLTDSAQLTWSKVADLDLDYYQIRFQPVLEGATWAAAMPIVNRIDGNTTSHLTPAIPGTYLIKAYDLGERESMNATLLVMNTPSLIGFNAVAALEDDSDFLGTKDEVNVVTRGGIPGLELAYTDNVMADWPTLADVLTLAGGEEGFEPIGYYYFEDTINLGGVFTCRITSDIVGVGYNVNNVMAAWALLSDVQNLAGVVEGETGVRLQIRLTDDDPTGSPTWGPWRDFVIGDYVFRGAQCRLVLETDDLWKTPRITRARVLFDMPDRTTGDNNLTSSVSGTTITFQPPFKDIPALAINGQSMSTGDRYALTGISRTAATVTFYNSGGTPVARTFDWIAQGWGYEYP